MKLRASERSVKTVEPYACTSDVRSGVVGLSMSDNNIKGVKLYYNVHRALFSSIYFGIQECLLNIKFIENDKVNR